MLAWRETRLTCRAELVRLAGRCQHPVVANALDAGGQNMQHEPAHELRAVQPDAPLAAMVIGPYRERHCALADGADALIADGRAVRVAAQILQHQGRATQRRLGVNHPVVFVELAVPLPICVVLPLRILLDLACPVRCR